jgi:hypothetical protein
MSAFMGKRLSPFAKEDRRLMRMLYQELSAPRPYRRSVISSFVLYELTVSAPLFASLLRAASAKRKEESDLTQAVKFDTIRKFVLKRHELLNGSQTG